MKSSKFMSLGEYVAAIIESVKKGCSEARVNPPQAIEFKVGVYDDGLVGGTHPVSFLVFLSNTKDQERKSFASDCSEI
jgi:hypothetical protein